MRADLEAFSPLAGTERIAAPVEVATGPNDKYFPASESQNLDAIAPDLRVTVTPAIDHAELEVSPKDATAFAGFDAAGGIDAPCQRIESRGPTTVRKRALPEA